MIFIPNIRIGGNPCGNDCTGSPCGQPVDPCDPPPDYPVYDSNGNYLCGPEPDAYLGPLFAEQYFGNYYAFGRVPSSFGGLSSNTFLLTQSAGSVSWSPSYSSPINCEANTSRIIKVLFCVPNEYTSMSDWPSAWEVTITIGGHTAVIRRNQTGSTRQYLPYSGVALTQFSETENSGYTFIRCPYTTTNCSPPVYTDPAFGYTFGTPLLSTYPSIEVSWDARLANTVERRFFLELSLWGYSA